MKNKIMKNKIIILAGTTASGKTTIQKELSKNGFHKVITSTTREPREKDNEKHGVDYFFYSIEEFKKMIKEEKFVEYEKFGSNFYGTPWESLKNKETTPCLIVEPKGAKNLKEILKKNNFDVTVIWVDCPIEIAKKRVKDRDKQNIEALEKRLNLMDTVESGWSTYMKYDLIINGLDNPEKNVEKIQKKINQNKIKKKI